MLLETARLLIRDLEPGDVDALVDLWTDPEVTRFMGGLRDREKLLAGFAEDLAAAARNTQPIYDLRPVVSSATDALVGHCGLLDKEIDGRDEVEQVYVIARDAWGQGYATEAAIALRDFAFDPAGPLGLDRLVALVEPGNIPSVRVAEKTGMVFERGVVRPGGRAMRLYAVERRQPAPP